MNRRDFFKIVPVLALAVSDKSVLEALQMRTYYGLILPADPMSRRLKHVFLDGVDIVDEYITSIHDERGWVEVIQKGQDGRVITYTPRRFYGDVRVVLNDGPQMGGYVKPTGKLIVGPEVAWPHLLRPAHQRTRGDILKNALAEMREIGES